MTKCEVDSAHPYYAHASQGSAADKFILFKSYI